MKGFTKYRSQAAMGFFLVVALASPVLAAGSNHFNYRCTLQTYSRSGEVDLERSEYVEIEAHSTSQDLLEIFKGMEPSFYYMVDVAENPVGQPRFRVGYYRTDRFKDAKVSAVIRATAVSQGAIDLEFRDHRQRQVSLRCLPLQDV